MTARNGQADSAEGWMMQRVVIDADLRARLRNLSEPLEFEDESGNVVGHYLPTFKPADADGLMKTCPYSEEELERFRSEPGGRTLAEIWRRLGRTE
jgi:hypothetical protein